MGTERQLNVSAFLAPVCSGGGGRGRHRWHRKVAVLGSQTEVRPGPLSHSAQCDVTDRKAGRLNYWGNIRLHFKKAFYFYGKQDLLGRWGPSQGSVT